jgi:hypothetical protein
LKIWCVYSTCDVCAFIFKKKNKFLKIYFRFDLVLDLLVCLVNPVDLSVVSIALKASAAPASVPTTPIAEAPNS